MRCLASFLQVTVSTVPFKPALLATIKSNNYLLNVLTAMDARDRGGVFGIQLDGDRVLEGCVCNVALVDRHRRFRTPQFTDILKGTTVRRAMEIAGGLVQQGSAGPGHCCTRCGAGEQHNDRSVS